MEHRAPQTLADLRRDLENLTPAGRIIGGGTDLVIEMRRASERPDCLLQAGDIPEFQALTLEPERLSVGAAVTMTRLHRALAGAADLAALRDAAGGLGSEQVRNRATVGGNAAQASPSGDLLPALRLLKAEVKIVGPNGGRSLPLGDFILGPGRTALAHNEAVESFLIRRPGPGVFTAFAKVGSRLQVTIARLNLALLLDLDGPDIRRAEVVLGAVAERPVRAHSAETALSGRPLNNKTLEEAGLALSQFILDINQRPNREYKAWAAPAALAEACRKIKAASSGG